MEKLSKKYEWNPVALIQLVDKTGCSRDAIAKACGMSVSSLLHYLDGTTSPSMDAVLRMADYFAVPVDVILGRATEEQMGEIYKDYGAHFMELRRAPYEAYLFRHSAQSTNYQNPFDMPLEYTLNDAPYPYNLIFDVFGEPLFTEIDQDHEAGLEIAITHLSDRERKCVEMMYKDSKNLEELGKEFNVTRERVRQITAKAVRKLRHPYYQQFIRLGVTGVEKKRELEEREVALEHREEAIAERENTVKKALEAIGCVAKSYDYSMSGVYDTPPEETLDSMPIDELDLSVRAYNCLRRANIDTFKDLRERAEQGDMIRIRNLGRRSMQEVLDKLNYYGYDFYYINGMSS